jgi:hypothetical protein
MEHLADTNILLRSIDQTHPMHADATTALSSLLTFNGPDFSRYPGIHVVHPNDVAKVANP